MVGKAWVGLLLVALLAGCAQGATPRAAHHPAADGTSSQDEPLVFQEAVATPTTGVVRGFVVDEAIRPLTGVTVSVEGAAAAQSTATDGAFAFDGLAPGDHRVTANKIGFLQAQTTAHVVAGDPAPALVHVQMAVDPVQQPYVETQQWSGFLECGVGTNGGGGGGRALLPCALGESSGLYHSDTIHDFFFGSNATPTFAQVELSWQGTQALGSDLKMDFPSTGVNVGGNGSWAAISGPSPLVLSADGPTMDANLGPHFPRIEVRILPGETQPATVTVEQPFDAYASYFYNFRPREGWSLVVDGACTGPAECG